MWMWSEERFSDHRAIHEGLALAVSHDQGNALTGRPVQ